MRVSDNKIKIVIGLLILVVAGAFAVIGMRPAKKDSMSSEDIKAIAHVHIAGNCANEVRKQRPALDCARIEMDELKTVGFNISGTTKMTGSGAILDDKGDMIWFNSIELNSKGDILKSDISYYDPSTRTHKGDTVILETAQ